MKAFIALAILCVGLSTELTYASTENTSRTATSTPSVKRLLLTPRTLDKEDIRDKREDARDAATTTGLRDRLEDIRDKNEDIRERGRENAIARIKMHLVRCYRILETAINRMEKLVERVQSRADKLEAGGADVSEAEAFLRTASAELTVAKTDLGSIKAVAEANIALSASTTPATVFGPVHELLKSARGHIHAAWKAIKDATHSLRQVVSGTGAETGE